AKSSPEARPVLVSGSVFKTDGAPRKRALGGFDSRALPLRSIPLARTPLREKTQQPHEIDVDHSYTPRDTMAYNRRPFSLQAGSAPRPAQGRDDVAGTGCQSRRSARLAAA